VNRSGGGDVPGGVELVAWDITLPEEARRAAEGAAVVYGCINAPYTEWPKLFPPLMEGLLTAADHSGARVVFADNLYMYGPVSGPLREDLPYDARGPKGYVRARMAERFLAAHEAGRIRGTIGRASDFFGPGVTLSAAGEQLFGNLLAGKPVDIIGDPDQPHTFTYLEDFGRALVTLGEEEEALGRAWHVPSAETLTIREFVALAAQEAGVEPKMRLLPGWLHPLLALVQPMLRELRETRDQFDRPFVVDHSAFQGAFGTEVTPHQEAVRATVAWYRKRSR
jgi:nucleoside-diphosphate-sugar epimerase